MHIVPALPPAADGVGGYAMALAERLAPLLGATQGFAVGDPAWRPAAGGRLRAEAVAERSPQALVSLLRDRRALVLHYAGYGYQARGCPRWLVDGLAVWRRMVPEGRLVTYFHEVYASGPPWRSSFWLSPLQRLLASRLARLSDALATSLDLYADLLRRLQPTALPAVLPVVSNVGEPRQVPALEDRPPRMAVFGGAGNRQRVYARYLPVLAAACRALGIEEIADLGPPVPLPAAAAEVPITRLGLLPPAAASAALAGCRAGFLAYPAAFLPKSGIFAAYCAHGLAPVCASAQTPSSGLAAGEHYLAAPLSGPAALETMQAVSEASFAWYAGHSLDRHAAVFRDRLLACAS